MTPATRQARIAALVVATAQLIAANHRLRGALTAKADTAGIQRKREAIAETIEASTVLREMIDELESGVSGDQ